MTNRQTRETLHSRQGGPRADHGADGAEAVRQVGADGGEDACAQAPPRGGWYGLLPPVGVEGEHAVRIRPTRDQLGLHPGPAQPRTPLAVVAASKIRHLTDVSVCNLQHYLSCNCWHDPASTA